MRYECNAFDSFVYIQRLCLKWGYPQIIQVIKLSDLLGIETYGDSGIHRFSNPRFAVVVGRSIPTAGTQTTCIHKVSPDGPTG